MSPFTSYQSAIIITQAIIAFFASKDVLAADIAYVALGDSYAAGIGSSPSTNYGPACYQADKSYVNQLRTYFDNVTIDTNKFSNRACAGLDLDEMAQCEIIGNVTADPDDFMTCRDLAPSKGVGVPDLVTLHMGAESINYYDFIQNCVYFPFLGGCEFINDTIHSAFVDLAAPTGPNFTTFLTDNLTSIAGLDPKKVKLINYVLPFNIDDPNSPFCPTFAGNNVTSSNRTFINGIVRQLNDNLFNSSQRAGVDYLDINPLFDGHRFCDKDPAGLWLVNPLPKLNAATQSSLKTVDDVMDKYGVITEYPPPANPKRKTTSKSPYLFGAFHPTADGHRAIAQLISQRMK